MTQQASHNLEDVVYDSIKWKWIDDNISVGKICKKLVLMQVDRCPQGYCSKIKWTKKSLSFESSKSIEDAQQVCMNGFADWIYKKADNFINLKLEDIKWETIRDKKERVVGLVADLDGYFELHVYTNVVLGIKKIMCNILGASDVFIMNKEFNYSKDGIKEAKKYCLGKLKSTLIAFREDYRKRNDQRVAKFDTKIDAEQEELLLFDEVDNKWGSYSEFKVMLVDKEDVELLSNYTWHIKKNRDKCMALSGCIKDLNGKSVRHYAHRIILGLSDGIQVRHKNGDGLDNRKCNLEIMSKVPVRQRTVFDHEGNRVGFISGDKFYKHLNVK